MRIVFCDDDSVVLSQLTKMVEEFFRMSGGVVPEFATYNNGEQLICSETRVDIAFLDVEMPGISGIHIGTKLKEQNPQVKIFIVTAYSDYLDEAMRFQVFRYLSKPIDRSRLFRNLKDAVYAYNMESREFLIETADGVFIRRAEEIIFVETAQRKVLIHTVDGCFVSSNNMDYWRQTLNLPCFFATHRSYIVNMRFVYSIHKDSIILKFSGKEVETFLARRKYTQFKDTYDYFLLGTL